MPKKQSVRNEEELLNIKQAAGFLNVSEASLRRWTDSGRMPCYRVGAQRARRFKRDDLVAFIGGPSKHIPATGDGSAGKPEPLMTDNDNHVRLAGLDIQYGHHICAIYGHHAGRLKLSVPLLRDGLMSGDVCFLIADQAARVPILEALQKVCPETRAAIGENRLILPSYKEDKERMLDSLEAQFLAVTNSGERKLRLVGDMQWALASGWDLQEIYAYELKYNNTLGHRFPIISLCQYDAEVFSGKGVLDALKSHEDTYQYPIGNFCM